MPAHSRASYLRSCRRRHAGAPRPRAVQVGGGHRCAARSPAFRGRGGNCWRLARQRHAEHVVAPLVGQAQGGPTPIADAGGAALSRHGGVPRTRPASRRRFCLPRWRRPGMLPEIVSQLHRETVRAGLALSAGAALISLGLGGARATRRSSLADDRVQLAQWARRLHAGTCIKAGGSRAASGRQDKTAAPLRASFGLPKISLVGAVYQRIR